MPRTRATIAAFYVQDQISLLNDQLVVTPGLRYDDCVAWNHRPAAPRAT